MAKTRPQLDPKPSRWEFFKDKIGIIALLLGLFSTSYSIKQIVGSVRPQLLQPEQVLVIPDKLTYPSGTVLRFATRMSYISTGPSGKAVFITKENVKAIVGAKKNYVQHWQSFENFSTKGCEVFPAQSQDVYPIALTGASATSHVTYFAPINSPTEANQYNNLYYWDQLTQDASQRLEIKLKFEAELLEGETLTKNCTLSISQDELAEIKQGCAVTLLCNAG